MDFSVSLLKQQRDNNSGHFIAKQTIAKCAKCEMDMERRLIDIP